MRVKQLHQENRLIRELLEVPAGCPAVPHLPVALAPALVMT